ncbi:MAG: enoyl-CoA hydratase-related protein [Saprospiraceae bacterium]
MHYEILNIDLKNGIAVITINREKALNALNTATMSELRHFFSDAGLKIDGLKGVVLTGAGEKAFVAGADITEFSQLDADQGKAFAQRGQDVFS